MKRRSFLWTVVAAVAIALPAVLDASTSDDSVWAALEAGGHVLVVRHAATESGIGDPPGFRLGDCGTQRNLSPAGREQAEAMGRRLAAREIRIGAILSSRWCRCLETARLAFGRVEPWSALDSFFGDRSAEPSRTAQVRARVSSWQEPRTLVLVTHQVNIAALTGESPAPGEAVVLRPAGENGFAIVGRVRF